MANVSGIQNLTGEITKAADSQALSSSEVNAEARGELLAAAKKLVSTLENTEDEAWKFVFAPAAHSCGLVAWQSGLLGSWPKDTMTSTELAKEFKIDPIFVMRIMRVLGFFGIFHQLEEEVYQHSILSKKLSTPPFRIRAMQQASSIRALSQLPEYCAEFGFINPGSDSSLPTLLSWTNKTNLEFFAWMTSNSDKSHLDVFNQKMSNSIGLNEDVGGGYGHLLRAFRARFPNVKGRLVLEDLPETVKGSAGILPPDNVEVQGFNFFTQVQPVTGARFYVLRHVLADWPDHACRKILQNMIPALEKGKSKILLMEIVLHPTDPDLWGSMMDVNMIRFGGMDRKEKQWRELVESVGLKLKVWPEISRGSDRILELVPKDW